MDQSNVVLTGFMGTGKTAVGRALADRLGMDFVDTDELIEHLARRTIAQIFADDGEQAFREMEKQAVRELAQQRGLVIATGGGLLLDRQNRDQLSSSGRIFCLSASPEEILERLRREAGKRPLLEGEDPLQRIRWLLADRVDVYSQYAQIDTDGKRVDEVATEIERLMRKQRTLMVKHPQGQYPVFVGSDLLPSLLELAGIQGPALFITDSNVGPIYARFCNLDSTITFPAGEQNKTLATVNTIYGQVLDAGLDRQGTIIALGGGVVGDVAGFVAATYMRGIDFVQVPTSLLAMVDASVGAKTGVDLPQGKNLVGAFKQPEAVLADIQTLATLPNAEFSSGMAEMIKHGVIGDPAQFELIEANTHRLRQAPVAELDLLTDLVADSIEVKRSIVEQDPFEQGKRAVLNLGHTFGHAIEQVSRYEVRHGEAVAMGLVAAAHLSALLGYCTIDLEKRIAAVLSGVNLPVRIPPEFSADAIYYAMSSDKKKASGQLRFILMRDLGDVFVSDQVAADQVTATLRHCGAN